VSLRRVGEVAVDGWKHKASSARGIRAREARVAQLAQLSEHNLVALVQYARLGHAPCLLADPMLELCKARAARRQRRHPRRGFVPLLRARRYNSRASCCPKGAHPRQGSEARAGTRRCSAGITAGTGRRSRSWGRRTWGKPTGSACCSERSRPNRTAARAARRLGPPPWRPARATTPQTQGAR
jgi:hypothetical protein